MLCVSEGPATIFPVWICSLIIRIRKNFQETELFLIQGNQLFCLFGQKDAQIIRLDCQREDCMHSCRQNQIIYQSISV